ncbi:MAG: hypothetical protein AB4062_04200, partial [Crocosphaera sp.]
YRICTEPRKAGIIRMLRLYLLVSLTPSKSKILDGDCAQRFCSTMGLDDADDIDSLILFDGGTIGQLDPGIDMAIFSLSSSSPSTITFTGNPYQPGVLGSVSPADYLISDFNGSSSACVNASDAGNDGGDGDATGGGSGSCTVKVPEVSLLLGLLILGSSGIAKLGLRKRKEDI